MRNRLLAADAVKGSLTTLQTESPKPRAERPIQSRQRTPLHVARRAAGRASVSDSVMTETEQSKEGVPIVSTTGILVEAQEKLDEHVDSSTNDHTIPENPTKTTHVTEIEVTSVGERPPDADAEAGAIRHEDTVIPTEVVEIPSQRAEAELRATAATEAQTSAAAQAPAPPVQDQDDDVYYAPGQLAVEQDLEVDVRLSHLAP